MVASIIEEHVGVSNRRFVVDLADGARVESVLYRGDTLCVSSQVGCAVGCPFCASGARGFARNLSAAELLAQLETVAARGHEIKRATVSGIGEPLHNLAAVEDFITVCRARGVGASLTTSGGPLPRLSRALGLLHNGLTISVHAGFEATRARLVPHGPGLAALFRMLGQRVPQLGSRRRRKLALAYLMLEGENDSDQELDVFVERARPLGLDVHLYDFNPVAHSPQRGVGEERYRAAYARLTPAGLRVRMSSRARLVANGGCGTLVALRPGAGARAGASAR
jgi:23S rRNA (adenine2503-C2)-methyltransferase